VCECFSSLELNKHNNIRGGGNTQSSSKRSTITKNEAVIQNKNYNNKRDGPSKLRAWGVVIQLDALSLNPLSAKSQPRLLLVEVLLQTRENASQGRHVTLVQYTLPVVQSGMGHDNTHQHKEKGSHFFLTLKMCCPRFWACHHSVVTIMCRKKHGVCARRTFACQ
jgi:hypothetical protein